MKNWSQLILQKMPDKISASQFLLVLLTLDSNLYHIFYTISFYTIIVQKNRTLFHKLFPPLSHRNVTLSFCPKISVKKRTLHNEVSRCMFSVFSCSPLRITSQDPAPYLIPDMALRIIISPVVDKQRDLSAYHHAGHDRSGYRLREQHIPENKYNW